MSKLSIDYKEKYLFAIFGKIQLQIFGKSFLEKGILSPEKAHSPINHNSKIMIFYYNLQNVSLSEIHK